MKAPCASHHIETYICDDGSSWEYKYRENIGHYNGTIMHLIARVVLDLSMIVYYAHMVIEFEDNDYYIKIGWSIST